MDDTNAASTRYHAYLKRATEDHKLKDVCALRHAIVRKYTKGIDVQLNKWLVMQSDVLSPMLCKEKASTGSLAE